MSKFLTLLPLVFAAICCSSIPSLAQCNGGPCGTPTPEVDPANACILPSPSSLDCYYGATTTEDPVSFPPWCGAIHNNHFFAFTADVTTVTMDISVFGCSSGNGLQACIFSTADCANFAQVSNCLGDIPTQTTATLTANNLTIGEVYYLCIDGSAGATCDYAINGSVPTVNGPTSGLCIPSSTTASYTVTAISTWQINPPSAGNIVSNPIGTTVNVQWLEPGPAQVCATSTQCPGAPTDCIDVFIGEDTESEEHVDVCQGYTTTCAGQTFSQAGSFMVNLPSYLNCDSIVRCVVHLIPTTYTTEIVNMCQGGSATCAGEEFFSPGTYPVKLTGPNGCDSIVNCKVNVIPTYFSPPKVVNLCGPAVYEVCNNAYTTSGLFTEICTGWLGCDSIINLNLAIMEPEAIIAFPDTIDCGTNATITLNGTASSTNTAVGGLTQYRWTGPGIVGFNNQSTVQVNQPGNYCLVVTHSRGGVSCADTTCVNVAAISAVPQLPQISGNPSPCGDSTYIYTATANGSPAPTSFNWIIPGNLSYTVLSLNSIQITWDTVVTGNLCVTANNDCGASQPACLPLAVQPPIQQPILSGPTSVCTGGGDYLFTLNIQQTGTNYTWAAPSGAVITGIGDTVAINFQNATSGQVCVTAQNACGIGTPVCLNVLVNPTPTADLTSDTEICAGESATLQFALTGNGPFDVIWMAGTQTLTLNNVSNGHTETVTPPQTTTYKLVSVSDNATPACTALVADSVVVTVRPNFSATTTAQICAGETFFVGGANQTISGVYTDSLQTQFGCDSVIVTTLTVFAIDTTVVQSTTCDPALAGSNTLVLTQANGCDSVVISTVVLLPSDSTLLFDKSCDINNVGVFTQNLTNQFGCDSTVVTTVTFALSDTTYLTANTCDPAQAGVFFNNLTSADGCDSLIITTVTALPLDTVLVSGTTCNLSASGVFTTVLPDQLGCDSTIITTITFVPLDTTFLTGASCDPSATGVFTNVLTTAGGCDSVLVTTVSLLPSSATALNGSSCNPAEVGVFTTVLTNQFGCDSTITTTIIFAPLDTTFLTGASCDPGATGVFTSTLQTAAGCDSVVVTTISLLPSNTTMLTGASCNPAETGVFTSVFSNQFGCDSTVITTVSLLPSSQTALQTTTCDPTQAGVFTYNLLNQFGCDSIVTETRALLPSSATTVNLTTCDPAEVGSVATVLTNFLGCDSVVTTITTLLPANACGVTANLSGSNIPCAANTGTMTLTVTVGTAPFTYTVLQGATTVATGTVSALNTATIIQNLPAGNYTVQVASPNGFSTSVTAAVIQLIAPGLTTIANSNYSGFDVRCPGAADGTALATATGGQSPYSYSWSNGGNTAQISGLLAGAYSATVTDANGCTGVSTVVLTEPTPLELSFVVNDLDCFGENDGAIQIQTSGGAPPYQFSLNGGAVQAENLFVGLNAGVFTLEVIDANNCVQEDAIVVNAAVPLDVDLGDDIKIGLGDQAVLQAVVNVPFDSILSVVWTPPLVDEECPNCLTHVVAPFVSTVYSVTVEALNGCTDEDKVTVIVDRRRQIYVPNVFSPNDDGANDLFSIYAKPGTVRKVVSLQIFDRWGNALYSLEDFLPNSPTIGWDGSYKGSPMNPGVFVWVAEIEFIDGEKEIFKGDVTIVR